ncbi:MAG: serine/threonine-protein phosphatase, partial [Oscillospiraceae bacterium]
LGTTVVVMLITQTNYYILNVGDSRAYEISDKLYKLTADQTVVAKEILQGKLTVEQAKVDPRRNVLLQCVGASNIVNPDVLVGKTKLDSIYMLCSDGFRHEITPQEIQQAFNPNILLDKQSMTNNAEKLIELNKTRLEKDNISVITIKTLN